MHAVFRPPVNWRHRRFRYRLVVWRCLNCGAVHHYATSICRRCRSNRVAEDKLPDRARLITYTVVKNPPVAFERQAPYIVGLVEFEDGTKLVAGITDCDPEELKPGIELERVVRKIAEDGESGLIVYGYRFRPAMTRGR